MIIDSLTILVGNHNNLINDINRFTYDYLNEMKVCHTYENLKFKLIQPSKLHNRVGHDRLDGANRTKVNRS